MTLTTPWPTMAHGCPWSCFNSGDDPTVNFSVPKSASVYLNSSLNHQREGTSPIRSPLDFTLVSRICTSGPTSQDSTRQLLCLRRHRSLCLGKMSGQNGHCGNLERQAEVSEVPQRSSKSSQVVKFVNRPLEIVVTLDSVAFKTSSHIDTLAIFPVPNPIP